MIDLNVYSADEDDLRCLNELERRYYIEGNTEAAHLVGLLIEFVQKQIDEDNKK